MLTIAIGKGRIYNDTRALLAAVGIESLDDPNHSRKLALDSTHPAIKFLLLRAQDVPTFVQRSAADVGITGKDTLLEYGDHDVYQPIDLEVSRCRLVVAGMSPSALACHRLRVATKYATIARRYFAQRGQQAEIIPLYGSVEIAPRVGIADVIVDIVDSGQTLAANDLTVLETITAVSARLIVNKASMKLKHAEVRGLMERIQSAVDARRHASRAAT